MNREALKAQLVEHEGVVLKPYKDTVGKLTIGVGRNLDDVGISRNEALILLDNDIDRVMEDLNRALPWWHRMSPVRQQVLADMCFNLGIVRLQGFRKALEAMRAGAWHEAAAQMLDSKWAKQVGNRATKLADMMRTG